MFLLCCIIVATTLLPKAKEKMTNSVSIETALKDACQITGALWAACVEKKSSGWFFEACYRLNKKRQGLVQDYFDLKAVDTWLCGAITGGRSRSRKLPVGPEFGVERLFTFPLRETQKIIIVGANEQSKKEQRVWRLLTNSGNFYSDNLDLQLEDAFILGGQTAAPYDLPRSLTRVLERIVHYVPCEVGWLAIYGDGFLNIEAHWHLEEVLGSKLSMGGDTLLARIKKKPEPLRLEKGHPDWKNIAKELLLPATAEVWGILPLMIGKRLIGLVALSHNDPFSEAEWLKLQRFSIPAATSVEMFVTFAEMAIHLKRQAMLNDFALIVSSAQNLDQIVRRVFALLVRTFGTESLSLFLLSSDGRTLRKYRNLERRISPRTEFVEGHPIANFIREGKNIRIESAEALDSALVNKDMQAALIVPLKYRGKVIGVLALESEEVAAFSGYDENLLVVISSHLAGLVEYGRLREEAEARAGNLGLIHEVVQQVIGLTNVEEVAQITADLLVQHFSYELAVVMFVDRNDKLKVKGISGAAAPLVRSVLDDFENPSQHGITGHVFTSGESVMEDDVKNYPAYVQVPGWDIGSEICVALREGDRILGIIDVEASVKNAFTHTDLMALESLAGFLTSVVSSVDRFQMLQDTNQVLQRTQKELQKRMEAQHAAENKLIQAAKLAAVGEMAAGIAHELNNPLTTVAGFSELVLEDLPAKSSHRSDLEMVLREAKRARSVVRRLLDFSRQSESIRVRADLNEVIEDVAALTGHLLETSNVDFEMKLGKDLPWVLMDRDQIKQVVLNLLHNALHAMPNGGKLSVQTEARQKDKKEWLKMAVQDTGEGIRAEDLDRIFEPFFTTKAKDGGTGLGLAVSYGIVTDHEGFIDFQTTSDEGTCFNVWLPIEENNQ